MAKNDDPGPVSQVGDALENQQAAIDQHDRQITDLAGRVDGMAGTVDSVAATQTDHAQQLSSLGSRVAELGARVEGIAEKAANVAATGVAGPQAAAIGHITQEIVNFLHYAFPNHANLPGEPMDPAARAAIYREQATHS